MMIRPCNFSLNMVVCETIFRSTAWVDFQRMRPSEDGVKKFASPQTDTGPDCPHITTSEARWWCQSIFYFQPYLGIWFPSWLAHIFQMGWFNHQLRKDRGSSGVFYKSFSWPSGWWLLPSRIRCLIDWLPICLRKASFASCPQWINKSHTHDAYLNLHLFCLCPWAPVDFSSLAFSRGMQTCNTTMMMQSLSFSLL